MNTHEDDKQPPIEGQWLDVHFYTIHYTADCMAHRDESSPNYAPIRELANKKLSPQ